MWLVLGSDSEAPLFALRTVYHFPAGLGTGIFGRLGGGQWLISVFHPSVLEFGNNQDNFQAQHYPEGAP